MGPVLVSKESCSAVRRITLTISTSYENTLHHLLRLFCLFACAAEDSNIFVMAMKHGVKRDATCELKHQSAQVSDNDCIDPLMVAWVKQ